MIGYKKRTLIEGATIRQMHNFSNLNRVIITQMIGIINSTIIKENNIKAESKMNKNRIRILGDSHIKIHSQKDLLQRMNRGKIHLRDK